MPSVSCTLADVASSANGMPSFSTPRWILMPPSPPRANPLETDGQVGIDRRILGIPAARIVTEDGYRNTVDLRSFQGRRDPHAGDGR